MYSAGLVNFHLYFGLIIYIYASFPKDIISKITLNKSTYLNNQDFNYTIFKMNAGTYLYILLNLKRKAVCELFIVSHTA